jgi:hypothetical protein
MEIDVTPVKPEKSLVEAGIMTEEHDLDLGYYSKDFIKEILHQIYLLNGIQVQLKDILDRGCESAPLIRDAMFETLDAVVRAIQSQHDREA